MQKLRKNACQKDIRENCLLSCKKMEKEAETLDPVGFDALKGIILAKRR